MADSNAGDWLRHETGDERDRWSQLEKSETTGFSNRSKSQPTPGWKDTRTRRGYLVYLERTGTIYGRLQGWEVKHGRDKADTWERAGGKLNVRRNTLAPPSSQPQVFCHCPGPQACIGRSRCKPTETVLWGRKPTSDLPPSRWGRGREKGMKPWANWHKPQLIEWSYRTYRAILLKKKEGCTSKTGFLEGMSVRKISLKTFPLFLCFAWPGQCKMHTPKISFNLARNSHLKRQTDFFFL